MNSTTLKHFFELDQSIPKDDRYRVVDVVTNAWINPFTDRAEIHFRVQPHQFHEDETRQHMAQILARTSGPNQTIKDLSLLLRPGRKVIPYDLIPETSETLVSDANKPQRVASAVFEKSQK